MTSNQFELLERDWELVQVVCNEAKKAQKIVGNTFQGKRFRKAEVRKPLNVMKRNHKKVKSSFTRKSKVLRKLSPRASNYIQNRLKEFDEQLESMTNFLNSWPWTGLTNLWHLRTDLENFATSYNNFGLEVKMYGDLVKNTIKRTKFTSSRTV